MESSPSEQSKGGPVITNSLGTGIALVVAALAAVGLSGGALTRSVRNFPIPISVILCVALIASLAIALLINKTGSAWANVVVYAAAVLLVIAACGAVALGAYSVHEREQPSVSLAAEYGADGKALVTVSVAAAGLSTQDQLVVQILGLRTFTRHQTRQDVRVFV
jgi:hypothetical protein